MFSSRKELPLGEEHSSTKRQEEILERMLGAADADRAADVMLLSDIAQAMRDASICGLGQTAANAIASGLTQLKVING